MLVWKKILELRKLVQEQKDYMKRCGGDLQGYIDNYGDPGIPPKNQDGTFKVTKQIPLEKLDLVSDLVAVPSQPAVFYQPHFGCGGTKIYKADLDRLNGFQQELNYLESNNQAKLKADTMENYIE